MFFVYSLVFTRALSPFPCDTLPFPCDTLQDLKPTRSMRKRKLADEGSINWFVLLATLLGRRLIVFSSVFTRV